MTKYNTLGRFDIVHTLDILDPALKMEHILTYIYLPRKCIGYNIILCTLEYDTTGSLLY